MRQKAPNNEFYSKAESIDSFLIFSVLEVPVDVFMMQLSNLFACKQHTEEMWTY